jgi:hypothetical protein
VGQETPGEETVPETVDNLEIGREVLNDHESEATVEWHVVQESQAN